MVKMVLVSGGRRGAAIQCGRNFNTKCPKLGLDGITGKFAFGGAFEGDMQIMQERPIDALGLPEARKRNNERGGLGAVW